MTQRQNRHYHPPQDLRALRARLGALQRLDRLPVLAFGLDAIDTHLPWGGMPCGCLHEVIDGQDGASTGFAGVLLARMSERGPVLWLTARDDLYPAGLERLGSAGWTRQLLVVPTHRVADTLWAMEESLRSPGLAGVLAETAKLTLSQSRRLQLAAETGSATGLILRRLSPSAAVAAKGEPLSSPLDAPSQADALPASAAVTRWRITSLPSRPAQGSDGFCGIGFLGFSRWRVELLRCRGGRPGHWTMEQNDETGAFTVVAEIPDRADRADAARMAL
jgi:protein ImuA